MSELSRHALEEQIRQGLDRLAEEEFYFYGVSNNCFKIDDMVLEVLEDPNDGYRSTLGAVCHSVDSKSHDVFFDRPLAKVVLKKVKEHNEDGYGSFEMFNGWFLVDVKTGHRWLKFGTDNCTDYYPYFTFNYSPDKTQFDFPDIDSDYIPFRERHPELVIRFADWFGGMQMYFDRY